MEIDGLYSHLHFQILEKRLQFIYTNRINLYLDELNEYVMIKSSSCCIAIMYMGVLVNLSNFISLSGQIVYLF